MGNLAKINTLLLVLIVLVNGFVILTPVVPALVYYAPGRQAKQQNLTQKVHAATPVTASAPPQPNGVTIPAMLLDQPVLEGHDTYAVLNRGILRWPSSSTPDKGGNTVLLGHRFSYSTPKGVLYYLDKVHIGDDIGVVWNNKKYIYKVREVREVLPTETDILANTSQPQLTIFTCTPLYWPKHRLVVIADQTLPQPTQNKEPTE